LEEVQSVVKLFRTHDLTATGFLHNLANENSFKENVTEYKYIHLATHGIVNEKNPNLSGIVFSQPHDQMSDGIGKTPETEYPGNQDGILFAGEMYNLDLNADLVVLSACETGLGKIINGEGIMSMTRGFIYSGTPNIVFSLWKVGDKNTCQLMIDFYSSIIEGESYSNALRKAKLKLIENEETAFPTNWAGFILVGIN
jgi:CHAT domain-containing protein